MALIATFDDIDNDWAANFANFVKGWCAETIGSGHGIVTATGAPSSGPTSPSDGDGVKVGAWSSTDFACVDATQAFDFIEATIAADTVMLFARWNGDVDTPTCYALELSNYHNRFWLYKVVAGVWTSLGDSGIDPLNSAHARLWFHIMGDGLWVASTAVGDAEPDWSGAPFATDSAIAGPGMDGLAFGFAASGQHSTIDNYYEAQLSVPPTILDLPLTTIDLSPFRLTPTVLDLPLSTVEVRGLAVGAGTTAHVLPLVSIDVRGFAAVLAPESVMVPTPAGEETGWMVHAVDTEGNVYATFPSASVEGLAWPAVNAPMTADVAIPIDAPGLAELPMPNPDTTPPREVQVWRNGALIFGGPHVTRRANSVARLYTYNCQDPLYHLMSRFMGEAKRHNFLPNGDFATFDSWATSDGGFTASIDATRHNLGATSAKLVCTDTAEHYLRTRFPMHATSIGLALFLTAWVFVEDLIALPASNVQRGLWIGAVGAGPGSALPYKWAALDNSTAPVGKWSRVQVAIEMPPNVTEGIECRLYGIDGTLYWDAASVTVMESLSFVTGNSHLGAGWDQTLIARETVRYLSGRMPIGSGYSKSNLNIADAGAPSGIVKERTYQFFDHQQGYGGGNGSGALDEWPKSSDGFDFEIEVRKNARIFRTHYPSIGKTWPRPFVYHYPDEANAVTGETWCVVGWDNGETLEGSATDVCEMGNSNADSGREEGGFHAPDALGGLTRELVEAAPSDAPIDLLDSLARSRGAQVSQPIKTPTLTMREPRDPKTGEILLTLIGVLKPGDIIPVDVIDGDVVLDGLWRVSSVVMAKDETLTVGIAK